MVLLVEWCAGYVLIEQLIKDNKIKLNSIHVVIIDTIGKYNIIRFMKLLILLGIKHGVIFDKDNGFKYDGYVNLIFKSKSETLTTNIKIIPSDIETFLDVKGKRKDDKPESLLRKYYQGEIDESKLIASVGW